MTNEKKLRTFAKLGFSHIEIAEIVKRINKLIASYHVHYQKLKNFHWNIKGADFFELHNKFEELYFSATQNIDHLAERIRVFGKTPLSTLRAYLEISEIKEVGTELTSLEMVKETIKDLEIIDSLMVDVFEAANANGDAATIEMMGTMKQELEKNHWMLNTWLNLGK